MNDMNIATVDLHRILRESDEGRRIIAEVDQGEAAKRATFNKQVQSILALRTRYFACASNLNQDEHSRLRQEIVESELEAARMEASITQEIEERRSAILVDFERMVWPLIEELAEANGIALILQQPQRNLIYAARELDITEAVIEALNERTEAVGSMSA